MAEKSGSKESEQLRWRPGRRRSRSILSTRGGVFFVGYKVEFSA